VITKANTRSATELIRRRPRRGAFLRHAAGPPVFKFNQTAVVQKRNEILTVLRCDRGPGPRTDASASPRTRCRPTRQPSRGRDADRRVSLPADAMLPICRASRCHRQRRQPLALAPCERQGWTILRSRTMLPRQTHLPTSASARPDQFAPGRQICGMANGKRTTVYSYVRTAAGKRRMTSA
jgi:hypothetical protein